MYVTHWIYEPIIRSYPPVTPLCHQNMQIQLTQAFRICKHEDSEHKHEKHYKIHTHCWNAHHSYAGVIKDGSSEIVTSSELRHSTFRV
jgi:hypothetical protein